jgi:hypothetical protein
VKEIAGRPLPAVAQEVPLFVETYTPPTVAAKIFGPRGIMAAIARPPPVRPARAGFQVPPLSVERYAPFPLVPANKFPPFIARHATDWEESVWCQLTPLSVETYTPSPKTPARRAVPVDASEETSVNVVARDAQLDPLSVET